MSEHRAATMDPTEYEAIFYFSRWLAPQTMLAVLPFFAEMRRRYLELRADPMYRRHRNGGCKLCGQTNYNEGVMFRHRPTGELIELGWRCAEKLEFAFDPGEVDTVRRQRKDLTLRARERAERLARLRAFVRAHLHDGLLRDLRCDHHVVRDIRSRVAHFGLTERQEQLVRDIANRPPPPPAVPVPEEGRLTVEGVVAMTRVDDTPYGQQLKMLLVVDHGGGQYKLWGTVPAALAGEALKGRRVRFTATVKRSVKDDCFGTYGRPTKACLVDATPDSVAT